MADSKKAGGFSGKWAIVTQHPRLPSRAEQIARARAWGVDESALGRADVSALIEDDARKVKRTTAWMAHLPERGRFIEVMRALKPAGDTVFFATPLCVGFTPKVARETVDGLWDAGMRVYVHSVTGNGGAIYQAGDELTEFMDMIAKAQNAAHQRAFRKSKS